MAESSAQPKMTTSHNLQTTPTVSQASSNPFGAMVMETAAPVPSPQPPKLVPEDPTPPTPPKVEDTPTELPSPPPPKIEETITDLPPPPEEIPNLEVRTFNIYCLIKNL